MDIEKVTKIYQVSDFDESEDFNGRAALAIENADQIKELIEDCNLFMENDEINVFHQTLDRDPETGEDNIPLYWKWNLVDFLLACDSETEELTTADCNALEELYIVCRY